MQVVRYGRRGGKTVVLLRQVIKDPNGILVCMNNQEVDRLMKEYPDVPIGRFVSVQEVRDGKLKGLNPRVNLYLDNADIILQQWLGEHVEAISVTKDV